jgi:hypothetical protein
MPTVFHPGNEEDSTTVGTKRGKKAGRQTTKARTSKAQASKAQPSKAQPSKAKTPKAQAATTQTTTGGRPATGSAGPAAPARRTAERPAPGPSLLDRAVRLRDAIQVSKLTAEDPWAYTAKARGWGQEAQAVVDEIARGGGDADALSRRLDALTATVEGDRDYQEARRRA